MNYNEIINEYRNMSYTLDKIMYKDCYEDYFTEEYFNEIINKNISHIDDLIKISNYKIVKEELGQYKENFPKYNNSLTERENGKILMNYLFYRVPEAKKIFNKYTFEFRDYYIGYGEAEKFIVLSKIFDIFFQFSKQYNMILLPAYY